MTSKNLFFNLLREDMKRRLWVIALSVIIFFFMFPVSISLIISTYTSRGMNGFLDKAEAEAYVNGEILNRFLEWVSVKNGFMVFLICILAILCAISGFSYLHSRRKTDFYHSLPVRREKLFLVSFVSGILYTAIPYALAVVIAAAIVQVKVGSIFVWSHVFTGYLFHMAFYLLIYATVAAAVILTGNIIVSVLGTAVFFSWGPAVAAILQAYCDEYYQTFYYQHTTFEKLLEYSSPVSYYIFSMAGDETWENPYMLKAAIALGAALMIALLALYLYKKRPSEGAGRAMAFKKSQAVIKFLLVVPAALFGSLFMRIMEHTPGWSVFGLLCGLILSYCVIEIIYNFDFRRLFSHRLQLALCTAASFCIFGFFYFDLSGYDSYLPAADKVESAAIVSDFLDGNSAEQYWSEAYLVSNESGISENQRHYIRRKHGNDSMILNDMEITEVEPVLAIAKSGIENVQIMNQTEWNFRFYSGLYEGDDREYSYVTIRYNLKSGREVFRSYFVVFPELADAFSSIYRKREYKQSVYPILKEDISNIAGINYMENNEYSHVKLPDDSMKEQLLTTYQEELLSLTAEVREKESPIGALQFKTLYTQGLIDQLKKEKGSTEYLRFNDWNYYPIYPSFTKTLALLKECKIDAGTFLSRQNIEKIEMAGVYKSASDKEKSAKPSAMTETSAELTEREIMIVRDKGEIQQILDASVSQDRNTENRLNKTYDNIEVTVYVLNEDSSAAGTEYYGKTADLSVVDTIEYRTYRLYLDTDKVPAFVKKSMPASFN